MEKICIYFLYLQHFFLIQTTVTYFIIFSQKHSWYWRPVHIKSSMVNYMYVQNSDFSCSVIQILLSRSSCLAIHLGQHLCVDDVLYAFSSTHLSDSHVISHWSCVRSDCCLPFEAALQPINSVLVGQSSAFDTQEIRITWLEEHLWCYSYAWMVGKGRLYHSAFHTTR